MTITQAIILGIVEGITEFLPISSTGHLILTSKLIGVPDSAFLKSFSIAIQFGAILAVVFLYWKKVYTSLTHSRELVIKVIIAFLPTAVVGFLLYNVLKNYLLSNGQLVIWSLAVGGIFLILFEIWHKRRLEKGLQDTNINYKKSFWIGLIQSLAIIPGVSRAGATIVGGLIMKVSRKEIVEFSFLLAVPTIAAATGYDLLRSSGEFSFNQFHILAIGFIISFVVAIIAIKWLLHFVKNHSFIAFGVYRIIIALVFWLII